MKKVLIAVVILAASCVKVVEKPTLTVSASINSKNKIEVSIASTQVGNGSIVIAGKLLVSLISNNKPYVDTIDLAIPFDTEGATEIIEISTTKYYTVPNYVSEKLINIKASGDIFNLIVK